MQTFWKLSALFTALLLFVTACNQTPATDVTITSPANGATIGKTDITVVGSVVPTDAAVTYSVDGADPQTVTVAPSGVFSFDVALTAGASEIAVTAEANNTTDTETISVTATPAVSAGFSFEAELSASSPTFTRPDDGSGLTDAERTNAYHTFTFTVQEDGWYSILSQQMFDGYILLYQGSFDPANPATDDNPIAENDDYGGGYDPDGDPKGQSQIKAELAADTDYILVTTACGDPEAGCGPNVGSFTTIISPTDPPPPPFQLPEPDNSRFNITVRFLTTNVTADQQAVFVNAANRWSQIITEDLSDIPLPSGGVQLDPEAAAVAGAIDDVLIDVRFSDIDGPSGVLGRAGPRLIRSAGTPDENLTIYGQMEFDISEFGNGGFFDDPQAYQDTITHEMGHVIGIGTLWELTGNTDGVLGDPPTVNPGLPNPDYDPRFTGPLATAEYQTLLTAASKPSEASVPIANTGGPGNYNGHWRELTFDNELMTPYAGGAELLSRMTAGSLGDIGYTVDVDSTAVDQAYALPPEPLPSTFRQTAPGSVTYTENEDYVRASNSSGSVSGAVQAVDLKIDESADPEDPNSNHPANSTSGCEATDFAGFTAGNIALLQRGACAFTQKAENALAAGAAGIVMFNQGDADNSLRKGLFRPDMGDTGLVGVGTTFALGVTLANAAGLEVLIDTPVAAPTLETLRLGGNVPNFDEELFYPVGTISPRGIIKYFPED